MYFCVELCNCVNQNRVKLIFGQGTRLIVLSSKLWIDLFKVYSN